MSDKDGGPAFPLPQAVDPNTNIIVQFAEPGMTLRDWFAGQALVGFLADSGQRLIAQAIEESPHRNLIQDSVAKVAVVNGELAAGCYVLADAMLAERSKS